MLCGIKSAERQFRDPVLDTACNSKGHIWLAGIIMHNINGACKVGKH